MRLRWLLFTLALATLLGTLEVWALADHLYWRYVWSDTLMHFLGGATIASFAVAIVHAFRPAWFIVLVTAMAVGWEVFEYSIGAPHKSNFAFDTSLDLLMDAFGAVVVYAVARRTIWRPVP